jgi:hypothetical protein
MEKGFIFILERVNLPKTGDICICIGEKGFTLSSMKMKPFSPIQMHISPVLGRFTLSSMKMKPLDKCVDL